ncbi:MAG: PAS domain-containing protein [Syntrophobacteraceae bacterium]|jgi:signal transduction histidine kinase
MVKVIEGGKLECETIRALLDFNVENKRFQTIIEGMGNGLMVTNEDLEVILHNPALMQLLELREEIKTPTAVTEIIRDEALIRTLKKILQGKVDEGVPVTQEIRIGERTLRAVSTPSLGLDRNVFFRISGTLTIFEDVTIFKEFDRMKSDFVNLVAHGLRSPLVSI